MGDSFQFQLRVSNTAWQTQTDTRRQGEGGRPEGLAGRRTVSGSGYRH